MRIGVLALQGGFIEHINMLEKLGVKAAPVYSSKELPGIDGLIIPGGESTTMLNLMRSFGMLEPLKETIQNGLPVMATCAGVVLLAKDVTHPDMETLSLMDIAVKRNAFGRQVDSFEFDIEMPAIGDEPFHAIFIRAPLIEKAGPGVEILGCLEDNTIIAVRQDNLLAMSFHPELGCDTRLHKYFLELVTEYPTKVNCRDTQKAAIPAD